MGYNEDVLYEEKKLRLGRKLFLGAVGLFIGTMSFLGAKGWLNENVMAEYFKKKPDTQYTITINDISRYEMKPWYEILEEDIKADSAAVVAKQDSLDAKLLLKNSIVAETIPKEELVKNKVPTGYDKYVNLLMTGYFSKAEKMSQGKYNLTDTDLARVLFQWGDRNRSIYRIVLQEDDLSMDSLRELKLPNGKGFTQAYMKEINSRWNYARK